MATLAENVTHNTDTQLRMARVEKQWVVPAQATDSLTTPMPANSTLSGEVNQPQTPQTLGTPASTGFAFNDSGVSASAPMPMGQFPAAAPATEVANETAKSESPERRFSSGLRDRGTGTVAANRFYRNQTSESENKKVPVAGDVPIALLPGSAGAIADAPTEVPPTTPASPTVADTLNYNAGNTAASNTDSSKLMDRLTQNSALQSRVQNEPATVSANATAPVEATPPPAPSSAPSNVTWGDSYAAHGTHVAGVIAAITREDAEGLRYLITNGPPQPSTSPAPENHFVSNYAYVAPASGLPAQIQNINTVAINGGENATFNPGVSAITPDMDNLRSQSQSPAPNSDIEKISVSQALDRYGMLKGKPVLSGKLPAGGEITLPKSMSKEDEAKALEAALGLNGVSLVNVGNTFLKAVPSEQAGGGGEFDAGTIAPTPTKPIELAVNAASPMPTLDAQQLQLIKQENVEDMTFFDTKELLQLHALQSLEQTNEAKLEEIWPQIAQDDTLNDLLAKRRQAQLNLARLTNDYSPTNVAVTRAQSLTEELSHEIDNRVSGIMASSETQVDSKKAALDVMTASVEAAKQKDQETALKNQPYYEAKRDLEQKIEMQKVLYAKLEAEKLDSPLPKSSITQLTDPAEPARNQTFWQRLTGQYESTARIRVQKDGPAILGMSTPSVATTGYDPYFIQTTFEIIQSDRVLSNVVAKMDLYTKWANSGEKLDSSEATAMLKRRLDLSAVPNTELIAIGVKDSNPQEAADLANAVANAYTEYRMEASRTVASNEITTLEKVYQMQALDIKTNQDYVEHLRQNLHIGDAPPESEKQTPDQSDLPLRKPAPNTPKPQPEILASNNAFSTFSMNVSDVSFKFAEASLQNGKLPDTASIRSEEFINAFDYRDPEAAPGQPMAFTSERARYPFAHNRDLLRFSIKTAAAGRQEGRPLNLVILLDTSGSMERADRVEIIREALRVLATQLHPNDIVSVVSFARTARLWADGISGDKAGETLDKVGGITPEGGTNLEEAMRLAYETARRHYLANGMNRVVLLTDGAANLGNVDPSALKQKVDAQRKQGIALDCFGIGWEDYNDDLLEQLSSNGDGRYAFLNSPEDASKDFAAKLAGALQVTAQDLKVQVEFNPQRVISYRQIGYATHQLTKQQFRDNTVAAGEIAAQEAGNALYTIETNPNGEGPIATVHVRYRIPGTQDYRELSWDVAYAGNAPELEKSSTAMRLAATASAFSEWLAASPYAQEVTPDALLKYLSGVPEIYGADDRPKQLETMIREAKSLEGK